MKIFELNFEYKFKFGNSSDNSGSDTALKRRERERERWKLNCNENVAWLLASYWPRVLVVWLCNLFPSRAFCSSALLLTSDSIRKTTYDFQPRLILWVYVRISMLRDGSSAFCCMGNDKGQELCSGSWQDEFQWVCSPPSPPPPLPPSMYILEMC